MIFYIVILIVLCLYDIKIFQKSDFSLNYLSKENTMSIRGIFMLLIIASHCKQYITLDGPYDRGYLLLSQYLGQTIVVVFLFYSGYGIYESIKQKGSDYVKTMPYKRILITYINLALALLLFLSMNLLLGKQYSLKTIAYSFTGWTSIGNSNWYIFAVLFCYIISWICFSCFKKQHILALTAITLLSALYMVKLYEIRPNEGWWYNTIFCYAAGMWYSYFKTKFENLLQKKYQLYYVCLLIACVY